MYEGPSRLAGRREVDYLNRLVNPDYAPVQRYPDRVVTIQWKLPAEEETRVKEWVRAQFQVMTLDWKPLGERVGCIEVRQVALETQLKDTLQRIVVLTEEKDKLKTQLEDVVEENQSLKEALGQKDKIIEKQGKRIADQEEKSIDQENKIKALVEKLENLEKKLDNLLRALPTISGDTIPLITRNQVSEENREEEKENNEAISPLTQSNVTLFSSKRRRSLSLPSESDIAIIHNTLNSSF